LHLGINTVRRASREEEVEDDVPIIAPVPSTGNSEMAVDRSFKMIYIPDAAMRIHSREKAQNDLGFIPTVLSKSEYEPVKHLLGSIHVISKFKARRSNTASFKVIMQEWVSASIG
jgi:hypothetical protein